MRPPDRTRPAGGTLEEVLRDEVLRTHDQGAADLAGLFQEAQGAEDEEENDR